MYSCATKQEEGVANKAEEPSATIIDSVVINQNSNRKFIRTAEMKFQTKDVRKTVYKIEDWVGHYGGFIEHNQLHSNLIPQSTLELNEDSVLNVGQLSAEAELVIRVPNKNLDSLLRKINPMIDYLENRTIKAEDVQLQMLANQLKAKRLTENKGRFEKSIDSRKGNADIGINAESEVLEKQMAADDYKINNMSLADKVNFSTVNMSIYQAPLIHKEIIENPKRNFEPNLLLRIWNSIKTGWYLLEDLVVLLAKFWTLIILLIVGVWAYRKLTINKA